MPSHRALTHVLASYWAITEEALRSVVEVAARMNLSPEAVEAIRGEPLDNTNTATERNGIATIPMRGVLTRYGNLFSRVSGATSFEIFARDLRAAVIDPSIRAIILAVDSPGGMVAGTQETGALVRWAASKKPVVSHIDGEGASAAYWVASAATEVVTGATSLLGSIGVRAAFKDFTKMEEKAGIETIEIVSSQSPRKNMAPVTETGRADIQAIVDRLAEEFVADVARNRGVSVEVVLSDFGQGGVFVGADAVTAGLADRVATYEELHEELETQHGTGRRFTLPVNRGAERVRAAIAVKKTLNTGASHAPGRT